MNNKTLIEKALEAKKMAHVPYSGFHVGAAVEMEDGSVYAGCNIEIVSYSPTICAERTAIFKAVSEGHKTIKKVAVVGDSHHTFPCGVCRQVIREFGKNAVILIADSVDDYLEFTLEDLLPNSFGPEELSQVNEEEENV